VPGMLREAVVGPSSEGPIGGAEAIVAAGLEHLAAAEEAGRAGIEAAGSAGVVEVWEEHMARWRGELAARAAMQAVEQAEALGRSDVREAQWAEWATVLAGHSPAAAGRFAAAQALASERLTHLEAVEAKLEERETALARVERQLEAVRGPDAEVPQREVARQESEGRAAVAAEHRALWAWMHEAERAGRALAAQRAVERVAEAEALGRQGIAEAEVHDLDLASVLSELRGMFTALRTDSWDDRMASSASKLPRHPRVL